MFCLSSSLSVAFCGLLIPNFHRFVMQLVLAIVASFIVVKLLFTVIWPFLLLFWQQL
jgi:hypothetical protein